jgi:DNA-binding CsgD family transcriptional regulator
MMREPARGTRGPTDAGPDRRGLRGRDAEIVAIDRLVNDARTGRLAGVMTILGDVGLGKSALLEHAIAAANGMRVLRCVGAPTEATLPFAGLSQMLRPILGLIGQLPGPQAAALRSVFGLSEDQVEDRFLISVGVLSLLSEAAEQTPLLCAVDEVRWLDHESADVLAFVARRIEAEPIAFVVALAEEDALRFTVPDPRRVLLTPLAEEDARAVVRDVSPAGVSPSVVDRIVRTADGVPLLLTELVSSLSPDQLEGRAPLPDALPVSPDVEALYLGRVRTLPASSQTALLVAAATPLGELKTIAAALQIMGLGEEALEEAARGRLVDVSDHVTFPHPAVRLAVYASASSADRRRVHDALASVLVEDADEDLRVWHRAHATIAPDEDVAKQLERSADRSAARSGDETGRARRLARAAEMAWLGGQAGRAIVLVGEAEASDPDAVIQARIDFVRAAWETQRGVSSDAIPTFLRAAAAAGDLDPIVALRVLLGGLMVMSLTGRQPSPADLEGLEQLARRASPDADQGLSFVVRVNQWMAEGPTTPAPGSPDRVRSLIEGLDDPVLAPFAIPTAAYLGDLGASRINGERVVRRARARVALGILSFGLRQLAGLEFWARRLDDARIHAAEGLGLGLETGNENVVLVHHGILAAVAAVRGEERTCRDEAEAALLGAIDRSNRDAMNWADLALGHLDLSLGRPGASDRFESIWARPWIGEPRLIGAADAVEAAARAGRGEVARARLTELQRWTAATGASWALPLVERCRALVSTDADAERHFQEALLLHEASGAAFDRARTQLLFGEFLRRARRRAEARTRLRSALETFAGVRAAQWEERARNELRATGEVVRHRDPEAIWQLTPQELQIARLVATGASNRDAAAELFLSPRTVEYHLRKVFTKLGISSRTELVRMTLADELVGSGAES